MLWRECTSNHAVVLLRALWSCVEGLKVRVIKQVQMVAKVNSAMVIAQLQDALPGKSVQVYHHGTCRGNPVALHDEHFHFFVIRIETCISHVFNN